MSSGQAVGVELPDHGAVQRPCLEPWSISRGPPTRAAMRTFSGGRLRVSDLADTPPQPHSNGRSLALDQLAGWPSPCLPTLGFLRPTRGPQGLGRAQADSGSASRFRPRIRARLPCFLVESPFAARQLPDDHLSDRRLWIFR